MTVRNHYNRTKKGAMSLKVRVMGFALCVVLLGAIGYYMWLEYNRPQEVYKQPDLEQTVPDDPAEPPPQEEEPGPRTYFPVGELIDTPERKAYTDGDIVLKIPRMAFEGPVLDGVEDEVLISGVGLFDQAQLPGPIEHNGNVSIAGHRDVYGMEFYDIDKVEIGDEIILTYQGNTYIYIVEQSFVTHSKDWEPIKVREYPCVTLQSCTPLGSAVDRIFVVGRLDEVLQGQADDSGSDETALLDLNEPAEHL